MCVCVCVCVYVCFGGGTDGVAADPPATTHQGTCKLIKCRWGSVRTTDGAAVELDDTTADSSNHLLYLVVLPFMDCNLMHVSASITNQQKRLHQHMA